MKLRWKIILGLAILAGIAAFLLPSTKNRARRDLEQTRPALRAQGFKVDPTEFDFSISPEIRQRASLLATTTMAEIKARSRPDLRLGDVPALNHRPDRC